MRDIFYSKKKRNSIFTIELPISNNRFQSFLKGKRMDKERKAKSGRPYFLIVNLVKLKRKQKSLPLYLPISSKGTKRAKKKRRTESKKHRKLHFYACVSPYTILE